MKHLLLVLKTKTVLVWLCILLAAGGIGSWWVVDAADHQARSDLLKETRLVSLTLIAEPVRSLSGTAADLALADYQHIKALFVSIRKADPLYDSVYLLGRRPDGSLTFFVDSQPASAPGYAAPGQVYAGAVEAAHSVFETGEGAVAGPVSDRSGTRVTTFEPVFDPVSGNVLAVVGIDIDGGNWSRDVAARAALPEGLLLALLLGMTFAILLRRNELINIQQVKLAEGEKQFRSMFLDHVAVMLLIDPQSGRILEANDAASHFYGYSREQLKSMLMKEINAGDPEQTAVERAQSLHREKIFFNYLLSPSKKKIVLFQNYVFYFTHLS